MRILVTSTAGAGHFSPLAPVAQAAARRGDDVLLVVPPALADLAAGTGHQVQIGADPPAPELAAIGQRVRNASRTEATALMNREFFGRLCTAAMLPAVESACHKWQPDLVLHEPCEYASVIAAGRCGLPHAQVAIGLAEVESSALGLVTPALEHYSRQLTGLLRTSPYLTRIPVALDPSPFPATFRYRENVGASLAPLPDWWGGSGDPLAYISFGSVTGRLAQDQARAKTAAACQAAIEAVAGLPLRVLLSTGRTRDPADLGLLPPNVHAEAWVDQDQVLGQAALVICHGGAGTTFGALGFGLPVVFVPIMADQPLNARLVTSAGAGIVIDPGAPRPPPGPGPRASPDARPGPGPQASQAVSLKIRAAIETIMTEPSYRRSAQRIAERSRAAPVIDEVFGWLARTAAGQRPGG